MATHVATITIDNTKVAADATDFPVYVDLSDLPAAFWDSVANGGGDIRVFKSDDTTELPREVVSCDTATDTGELHFKYSGTLSSSADTEVHIYADGVSSDYAVTDTYGAQNVWTNGYLAVYHLESLTADSTSGGYTLTNLNSVTSGTGKIEGDATAGTSNSNKRLKDETNFGRDGQDAYTWSLWMYQNTDNTSNNGNWAAMYQLWREGDAGGQRILGTIQEGGGGWKAWYGVQSGGTNTYAWDVSLATSEWNFMVMTQTAMSSNVSEFKYYWDGSLLGTDSSVTNTSTFNATNGEGKSQIDIFSGEGIWYGSTQADEARYQSVVRSSDWITTEYNNQNSPSTFYSAAAVGGGTTFVPYMMIF